MLMPVSVALGERETGLRCETTDTGLVVRVVCVLNAPTYAGATLYSGAHGCEQLAQSRSGAPTGSRTRDDCRSPTPYSTAPPRHPSLL